FLGDDAVKSSIAGFYQRYKLKPVKASDFEHLLKSKAGKDIDWFFNEYVGSNVRLDFTLKEVKKKGDSLRVVIKNKEDNTMPVSLFGLDKHKNVVAKYWVEHTRGLTEITIPRHNITRLALN